MHSVETMNHLVQPSLQAENQPVFNPKSKPAAVLNWLLRDMKSLPRWPVISVLAMCISVAIGTSTSTSTPPSNQGYARLFALPSLLAIGVVQTNSSQADQSPKRVASIQGGAIKLKVADWPHIGPSDAKYVMVELFDYCCPPCRETFKAIRGAQEQLGGQLAIILLPVPLNSDCNPTIQVTGPHYKESCALSKLAVAMWRVDPEAFTSLHMWMLKADEAPSYAETIAKARTLADPEKLDAELASGVPDQFIARHVALYKRVGEGSIPKLMFPRTSVVGKFTSVDGLIDLIRREAM